MSVGAWLTNLKLLCERVFGTYGNNILVCQLKGIQLLSGIVLWIAFISITLLPIRFVIPSFQKKDPIEGERM